jgi:glucose/mannose-6-phosphate isomerase
MGAVATRWRGQFAENSKTLASSNVFPEMSHNEIVGWENPRQALKDSAVIMLKDRSDDPSVSKRMQIVKRMLKKKGVDVIDVNSTGKELLGRIFSLVYIADFVSFYLAILNKVDPTPIESITYLKKELAK